jgi:hypothetical protein
MPGVTVVAVKCQVRAVPSSITMKTRPRITRPTVAFGRTTDQHDEAALPPSHLSARQSRPAAARRAPRSRPTGTPKATNDAIDPARNALCALTSLSQADRRGGVKRVRSCRDPRANCRCADATLVAAQASFEPSDRRRYPGQQGFQVRLFDPKMHVQLRRERRVA